MESKKKKKIPMWTILFWLLIWQLFSMLIDQQILLASPFVVLNRLVILIQEGFFWLSIGSSLLRIAIGLSLSFVTGIAFAIIAHSSKIFRELIMLPILCFKSIPVASFVILILIWFSSSALSIIVAFIMVLPIVYTNMLEGIESVDKNLLEVIEIFEVKLYARYRYVFLPKIVPYFRAAVNMSVGICFKAGIAAEVIGLPDNSIGENLYESKIFLDTPSLFAWTIVIAILSFFFGKLITGILDLIYKRMENRSL